MAGATAGDGARLSSFSLTYGQQMASACSGALITSLIVTPFDVVKTRLQAQARLPHAPFSGQVIEFNGLMDHLCICEAKYNSVHLNGTLDAFQKIRQNEGVLSLWRGLSPTMFMALPTTVMYFTAYDSLVELMGREQAWAPLAAGTIARAGAVSVISPLEMVRTKMQAQSVQGYRELLNVIRNTVRVEGWTSLWRGLSATLFRDVPFSAIYWSGYESLKPRLNRYLGHHPTAPTFLAAFSAGALSGTVAATVTLPFDVVKTRLQTELGQALTQAPDKRVIVPSTLEMMRTITATEGWRGLFVGLVPRIAKVAPACAIMISSYELSKDFFRRRNQSNAE